MTVGLNSSITDFERKKLNLILLVDVSGSMSSPFSDYYYGGSEQKQKAPDAASNKSKVYFTQTENTFALESPQILPW